MSALLRELLSGIIDYAGLFPPAKLSMPSAIEKYNGYRSGPESWIVSRFLCPASRLQELGTELHRLSAAHFTVGVIGTGGADYDSFQTGLEQDAKAMTAFEAEFERRAPITGYEVRLPSGASVEKVSKDLRAFDKIDVFLELPWNEALTDNLAALAEQDWLGGKARTGGLEASAFPLSSELSAFLKGCQDLDLSFKLTAGLHHPTPRMDEGLGIQTHGFANVLAALALNDTHDLSTSEMAEVLESGDVEWGQDEVRWMELAADREQSADVRTLFVGFGSCSVEEPLEDLAMLGLLGKVNA